MVKVTEVSAHPKGLGTKEAAKAWYSGRIHNTNWGLKLSIAALNISFLL